MRASQTPEGSNTDDQPQNKNGTSLTLSVNPEKLTPEVVERGSSFHHTLSHSRLTHIPVVRGSKFILVERPLFMSYIWVIKACIVGSLPPIGKIELMEFQVIYYYRITSGFRELVAIKVTAAVLSATWLINMLAFFLECRPVQLYWQVLPLIDQCAVSTLNTHNI